MASVRLGVVCPICAITYGGVSPIANRSLAKVLASRPLDLQALYGEDRSAAEAGFLAMSSISAVIHQETEQWSEPQGGLHYRWLAIYCKAGTPEPTASFKPRSAAIALHPCDGVFGGEGRQAFAQALQNHASWRPRRGPSAITRWSSGCVEARV